jgi:hypothetical protein
MSDERLPELFADALELDESARAALLAELCREQPLLGAELARLLACPESSGSPIDCSAMAALGLEKASGS